MIYGQIQKSNSKQCKVVLVRVTLQLLAMLSIEKYKTHHCTLQPGKKKNQTNKRPPSKSNPNNNKTKTETKPRQLNFDTRELNNR